jgi:type IV pilus assembly protein PilP
MFIAIARSAMPSIRRSCLFAALLLAGCASNEHNDLKDFVAQSEQGSRARVEPLALPSVPQALVYEAYDEPDPFSSTRSRAPVANKLAVDWAPPATREALEGYPLAALRMVGTMQREGQRWALIQTPDRSVYRVAKGNRLGENFGAIAEITETFVRLNEHVEDGGQWTERVASLNLVDDNVTN